MRNIWELPWGVRGVSPLMYELVSSKCSERVCIRRKGWVWVDDRIRRVEGREDGRGKKKTGFPLSYRFPV